MNNTHQQPSGNPVATTEGLKYELASQLQEQLFGSHTVGEMRSMIIEKFQSLLTSHSKAIRERVNSLPTHYIHEGFKESIPVYKKDDILALLNESDVC